MFVVVRILPSRCNKSPDGKSPLSWVSLYIPLNLTTVPFLGVIFLLSTTAIGRRQILEGTVGANNISPLDILAFAFTIGYISCSIDATGILRYLCIRVLSKYGAKGRWFFCFLYLAVFLVGLLFGNDPIIQMGMLFITYMTKLSSDIKHPRAWLFTQFAVANIASTILVSSSTTNVIISQAFKIGFAEYAANVIVPVVTTVVVLPPVLLFVIFAAEGLIPASIQLGKFPKGANSPGPTNPALHNGTHANMGNLELRNDTDEEIRLLLLADVLNPFLDKGSAAVGFVIMFMTLIVLLVLTAKNMNDIPVFWISLPASGLMLCWDVTWGWVHRKETRIIARQGRDRMIQSRLMRDIEAQSFMDVFGYTPKTDVTTGRHSIVGQQASDAVLENTNQEPGQVSPETGSRCEERAESTFRRQNFLQSLDGTRLAVAVGGDAPNLQQTVPDRAGSPPPYVARKSPNLPPGPTYLGTYCEAVDDMPGGRELAKSTEPTAERQPASPSPLPMITLSSADPKESEVLEILFKGQSDHAGTTTQSCRAASAGPPPTTLASILESLLVWLQETFPTAMAVSTYLPIRLIPFALPTFILVQSLVSTGWVTILALGWDTWAMKTGTIGAIGGMGFLSVVLCNVSPVTQLCHLI